MATFEEFCGGPIWNNTEFMTSSWPQFTDCFQNTVLVWLPCGIALLIGPCHISSLSKQGFKPLPITPLNVGKLFCQSTLTILTLVALLQQASQHTEGNPTYAASYVADIIKLFTYAFLVVLGQYERRKGVHSSILQFAFWVFNTLTMVISAYTYAIREDFKEDFVGFVIFYISFALSLACVILYCFSEQSGSKTSKRGYQTLERHECPLVEASAISRIFFFWMFKLVRTGFKRDLEELDMWNLPPSVQCEANLPTFEMLWREEERRCAKFRKKAMPEYGAAFTSNNGQITTYSKRKEPPTYMTEKTRLSEISEGPRSVYTHLLDRPNEREESEKLPKPSLIRVLWKQYKVGIFHFTWSKIISDLLVISGPLLLNLLITYMNNREEWNEWQGYGICVLMFVVGQFRIAFFNYSMFTSYKVATEMKSVVITSIYKKAMRINSDSKKKSTVGDIVNLMSVDAQRIQEFMVKVSFCHTTPIQIIVSIALIYLQIGPSVLVGFLVLFLLIPLNILVAARQRKFLKINLSLKDTRIRMMNEILNGVKVLKLYAWEQSFHDRVQGVRAAEIGTLLKIAMMYVVTGVCWNLAGFLITLATFATFILSDPNNYLDPGRAFMTLALFNILKTPMDFMSSIISLSAQAYVSAKRINDFLLYAELSTDSVITMPDSDHAVTFEGAEATWDTEGNSALKNINLHVPQGKLVAVVGPVGSGKSSLLSAILGDMEKKKGTITRKGALAYVPQQAWIQNATVRDNIMFGKAFRERKYKTVVSACELERDFTILSAGDQTEIGEKGINLSGGQKQRVSVARAVYQDCDLYLLDDPLSAVDSHVGKAMFEAVVGPKGLLKNKTRIFVTHGVHFLPQVDTVVVMNEGQISEMGTYEELLAHDGPFAQFLKTHLTQEQLEGYGEVEDPDVAAIKDRIWDRIEMLTSDAATSGDEGRNLRRRRRDLSERSLTISVKEERSMEESKILKQQKGKLITTEVLAKGRVEPAVYYKYFKAAGILPLSMGITLFWCFHAFSVGTNYWLTGWTEDSYLANRSHSLEDLSLVNDKYLGIYALFGVAQLIFLIGYYYLFWTRMVMAGRNLHSQLTTRVFKAPMAFFDTTPIGRLLNRCSRDVEIIDNWLPIICRDFLGTFCINVVTILVIMIETPIFGAVLIPVIFLFYSVLRFFVPTSRQLRRIEHVTRTPIFTHFSESVSGASVIRAYGATERFVNEEKRIVDYNTSYFFAVSMAIRWLSVHLDTVANIVIFSAGFFQVLSAGNNGGQAGLTVSYALQISGALPWMVRQLADFETNIVSVERIKEYSEIEQEADWVVSAKRPLPNWPSQGVVEFNNFSIRYREGLDLVIKNMSVRIEGGEKVGIVGRTGAGKSSLSLSLFRLMEASGGSIMVDGINIADIGLHDLRSRLTILPQDPVLFSGTLRMNLDPFDEFIDDDIWTALERAHLKQFVNQLPGKLMYECGEEGLNLSVGQRQLVCLARTLLRKTKVLVLDEATAAVDIHTDALIQNTIQFAFQNCTVIAIAHRLNTIMDYDKVMVLDAGLIKEFDAPAKLLEDRNSDFYSMASDANLV